MVVFVITRTLRTKLDFFATDIQGLDCKNVNAAVTRARSLFVYIH